MADIIEMPKLSDTMTVGTLVKWLKNEGDPVKSGDILAEVETDKATMELESFFDGVLLKQFVEAGSQVAIGAALCAIGKAGEKVEAPKGKPAPQEDAGKQEKKEEKPAAKKEETPSAKKEDKAAATDEGKENDEEKEEPTAEKSAPETSSSAAGDRVRISPLARKLAEEKKIDWARITGSGPRGRIVKSDILAAAKSPPPPALPAAGAPEAKKAAAEAWPWRSARDQGPVQAESVTPLSNMRATIARRLVESKSQIPHFYLEIEVDAAPLNALRDQLNTGLARDGVKLSVNDFVLKASALALRAVPAVNGSFDATGIKLHGAVHVSFAVAIDDGLITPVIKDTDKKSLFDISTETKTLARRARDKKLTPAEFTGGTFCVSNLGMMGIGRFSAIINPPNGAILAVGATVRKPVVKGDQIVIGERMVLTLSCDHRIVDGALGAKFLNALKAHLEAPALLLV